MEQDLDTDRAIVRRLEALANMNRLQVLRSLRAPRALHEITIRAEGEGAPIARQAVKRHLDILVEAEMVRTRGGLRDYGETTEYVVDHQAIFSITEEIQRLARIRPTEPAEGYTHDGDGPAKSLDAPRPCLLLVSGLDVGTHFDLRTDRPDAEWVIGRRRNADIPLDFDASVSSENAVIRKAGGGHEVEDLPGSRNGTRVNGRPLSAGESRPLAHGDLIAVGRCLLLYWR